MKHVTKETAVLLKEKGFDLPCIKYFDDGLHVTNPNGNFYINWNAKKSRYSAPTLYEATEWLRTKGVHVVVQPDGYGISNELFWVSIIWVTHEHLNPQPKILRDTESDRFNFFPTHDEALEAGIVHALKYLP
jgi:hypothetical protein